MKKLLFLSLVILGYSINVEAQQYDPQLLILSPGNITFDPILKNEIDAKNAELKKLAGQTPQQPAGENQPANFRLMQQSTISFIKNISFIKEISLFSQQYLAYRFYEKFPNCLLLLKDTLSDGKLEGLQKIAATENTPYVLNFPKIMFYKDKRQTYCKMTVQLYERQSNSLLIDKEYTGNWNNPGFEFACKDGSIECTVNNSLSQALADVVFNIASNNPTLKREKALAIQRATFIANSIYSQHLDASLIRRVIPTDSAKVKLNDLYQCFYNNDSSKFVGFFISEVKKGPKGLLSQKEDNNVKIITSKDIHDKDYLDRSPQTYAYIVRGVKYAGKWYFEKSEVTYFDAQNLKEGKLQYLNNLQRWNFFADNTTEPSSQFWEGALFKKIEDKRKDPNWEKYKDMWETEERENRDYIGIYELVATDLKKEKEATDEAFRNHIKKDILVPFYNAQVKSRSNHFMKIENTAGYFALIYPKDHQVMISPLEVTDENGIISIRYFILLPQNNEIFEWTLVKPYVLKKGEYSDDPINNTIGAFTKWNFSYPTLDDDKFWSEKVLAKDGDNYKYLVKLK